jgi:hypothetical protein
MKGKKRTRREPAFFYNSLSVSVFLCLFLSLYLHVFILSSFKQSQSESKVFLSPFFCYLSPSFACLLSFVPRKKKKKKKISRSTSRCSCSDP